MQAPKPKSVYQVRMSNFLGIDLRNSPSKTDFNRSPNAVNLIRDTVGTNKKRNGYETAFDLGGKINGFHTLKTPIFTKYLIHAGKNIYLFDTLSDETTLLYSEANDDFSVSKQMNSKLYMFDGKDMLIFDGISIESITNNAKIPITYIARGPSGGGKAYEPINLISKWMEERFTGTEIDTVYQLSQVEISEDTVKVKKLTNEGALTDLTEGTDFTVNRLLGTVTFISPHKTPITGQDNLYITYAKEIEGYSDRIKKCTVAVLYGMSGQRDRLFVSGNPHYPNYDWYCKANDPSYFGDTWYSVLGQDNSAIIGYSVLNGALLTYKDGAENDSNVVLRNGVYDNNLKEIVFPTQGNYEAAGALGKHTFETLQNEPVYLTTEKTIHAITQHDYSGERSSQERSYFISSALAAEENLEEAYSLVHDGFYMLAVGDKIYILDSKQPCYQKDTPYSNRQYECYLWTHIGARILGEIEDRIYFGTSDGKVKRFLNQEVGGYTDDGETRKVTVKIDGKEVETTESFPCYWETAEIYCGSTDHSELKKTFKHLVVLLNSFSHTGCRIYAKIDGIWEIIFDYDSTANYFDWNDIDFNDFSFNTDDTPTLVGGKFKVKKVLHIQFRFENNKPQPFSVLFAKAKYTVGNEYRK